MAPVVYSILEIQWIVLSESELSSSPATNSLLCWTSVLLSLRGFERIVLQYLSRSIFMTLWSKEIYASPIGLMNTGTKLFRENGLSFYFHIFFLDAKINKKFPKSLTMDVDLLESTVAKLRAEWKCGWWGCQDPLGMGAQALWAVLWWWKHPAIFPPLLLTESPMQSTLGLIKSSQKGECGIIQSDL